MYFAEQTWPTLANLSREIPVVIPIAAIEQHGHHMPVATDTILLTEIVSRVHAILGDAILVAPVQWFGNSDHHLDFGGTLSAPPRVYLDMLIGITENMISAGFKRIVFLNGHGGNDVPAKQATFELRQRYRHRSDLLLLMTTYWSLDSEPWKRCESLVQRDMGHACEWETSMMLAINPGLVKEFAHLQPVEPGNPFRPGSRAWITKDRTEPGHIGHPQLASKEKGLAMLETFGQDVASWLKRIIAWDGSSWDG
ncbi:creatininase family protein [Pirellulaceae bacterium SH449]